MICPKCYAEMSENEINKKMIGFGGPVWLECEGQFGDRHPLITYFSPDRTFQTLDNNLAQWFRNQGWHVYREGKYWNFSR